MRLTVAAALSFVSSFLFSSYSLISGTALVSTSLLAISKCVCKSALPSSLSFKVLSSAFVLIPASRSSFREFSSHKRPMRGQRP